VQGVARSQNLFRNETGQMKVARHNHSPRLEIGFELRCQIPHYIRKEIAENNVGLRQILCPKVPPFYLYVLQTKAQELAWLHGYRVHKGGDSYPGG
jgi:hypothetical protein